MTAVLHAALREAARRCEASEPCWCGDPFAGHAGWLVCVDRVVDAEGYVRGTERRTKRGPVTVRGPL